MTSSDEVQLIYVNRQGGFLISYRSSGRADLSACGLPAPLNQDASFAIHGIRALGQEDSPYVPYIPLLSWEHAHDVHADRESLDDDRLFEKYSRIFLQNDIGRTLLEPPAPPDTTYLEFPVTVFTGLALKAVLRSDGHGYLVGRFEFRTPASDAIYVAPNLFAPFRHTIRFASADGVVRIVDDAVTTADPASAASPGLASNGLKRTGFGENQATDQARGQDAEAGAAGPLLSAFEEVFWNRINPTLEAPWIRTSQEIEGKPLAVQRGTEAQLLGLLADATRVDSQAWQQETVRLVIYAESAFYPWNEDSSAELTVPVEGWVDESEGDNSKLSPETIDLMEIIIQWARPFGLDYRTNGDNPLTLAGYTIVGKEIAIPVEAPTASERMEALGRLVQWSAMSGIDIDAFLPE